MSDDRMMVEMTYEEFLQREQQTTKLAEALDEANKDVQLMREHIEYMETKLEPMFAAEREKWATVCDWFDAKNPHIGQAAELAKMLRNNTATIPAGINTSSPA